MAMHIWWVRRDLRLADNQALNAAMAQGAGVLPVFILDANLLNKPAEKRQAFLFGGLRALQAELRRRSSDLIVREGEPAEELARLASESGAAAVFAEEDVSPYARRRDAVVGRELKLRLVAGLGVHPVGAVLRGDGEPYKVFTPFSRVWKSLPLPQGSLAVPEALPPCPALASLPIPGSMPVPAFPAGEREAQRRLAAFCAGPIYAYTNGRNRMDLDGTSVLSAYLRFGMLSATQAAVAARQAAQAAASADEREGAETWLNELIWREFYQSILFHFPQVLGEPFREAGKRITWRQSPSDLRAWQEGLTGYPVVDAGMRQLAETGWMHNRARMICASFLVKHLLINWQEGEQWFMRSLVDGDPAANNGGWQWTAGTGTDAVPYFRVFNPTLQGQKFDPEGAYVRRWVPELAKLQVKYVHTPWLLPEELAARIGFKPGQDYPHPLVDHKQARARALAVFKAAFNG